MHKDIQRFSLDGTVGDDAKLASTFVTYRTYLLGMMYDNFFVPRLDIDEVRTIDYDGTQWHIQLSLYGVYEGVPCQGYYIGNNLVLTKSKT